MRKVGGFDEELKHPICMHGKHYRPPEDIDGEGGYKELLNIINDPNHVAYDEILSWAKKDTGGRKFDTEYFYKAEINRKLAKINF
nr:hypothetical protein [Bacillus andreraoultii]